MNKCVNLFFLALSGLSISAKAFSPSPLNVTAGSMERTIVWSPELSDSVTIDIWLPPHYDASKKYPVLYMHDGQNLFDAASTWNHQAWEIDSVAGALIETGEIEPFICVGIHSKQKKRVSELMPVAVLAYSPIAPANTDLFKHTGGSLMGDAYLNFVCDNLKPIIDNNYSTLTDVTNTAVAGSSMGGLMSLYSICQRPATFGAAACISTHIATLPKDDPLAPALIAYMRDHLPSPATHKLYFDTGTTTIDANYVPYFSDFTNVAVDKGYTEEHLLTKIYKGHAHDEKSWAARVCEPLKFIFKKKNT